MRAYLILVLLVLGSSWTHAQWTFKDTLKLPNGSIWEADLIGNVYIAKADLIEKIDTAGRKQFSQSIKSLGNISQIQPINTMKILLFSAEQQSFTLIDNTLSTANSSYDLNDFNFGYVPFVAISAQPNKLWVYDQLNSKLVFLDYARSGQRQEIENLRGLLGAAELTWMKESGNKLFVLDSKNVLYVFDLYGSLLRSVPLKERKLETIQEGKTYVSDDKGFYVLDQQNENYLKVALPVSTFSKIAWRHKILFVQQGQNLLEFKGKF